MAKEQQDFEPRVVLVTGGAGFIGSNFIHYWLEKYPQDKIRNLDALTYAGHLSSLEDVKDNPNYEFVEGNITDEKIVNRAIRGVDLVVHFAAESHVDRSNIFRKDFFKSNVMGTVNLLDAALEEKVGLFHHVSTDEVFGQLEIDENPWTEESKYNPNSLYAASKAGADHAVRAYHRAFGLPIKITNCANNYGPYHDPEKFIPRFITYLLEDKKVPLMGKGENIREWLHTRDHSRAIDLVINKGRVGDTYLIGGTEKTNYEITKILLKHLEKDESYIEFVSDRLAHDKRYAIDDSKIRALGWKPEIEFNEGLRMTIEWFMANQDWWKPILENKPNVDRSAQKAYIPK